MRGPRSGCATRPICLAMSHLSDASVTATARRLRQQRGSMSTTVTTSAVSGEIGTRSRLKALAAVMGVMFLAIFMALTFGIGGASAADLQCSSVDNTPGLGITCQIAVVNNVDLNDPTNNSSTTTLTS